MLSGGVKRNAASASSRQPPPAAMAQFQQRSHTPANLSGETSRDRQRKAGTQQLNQIAQRNTHRGYDGTHKQQSSRGGAADTE